MTATHSQASDLNLTTLRQRAPLPTLPALPALASLPQPEGLSDAAFNARLMLSINAHPSLEAHAHALVYALLHGQPPAELTLDLVAKVRADLLRQDEQSPVQARASRLGAFAATVEPNFAGLPSLLAPLNDRDVCRYLAVASSDRARFRSLIEACRDLLGEAARRAA